MLNTFFRTTIDNIIPISHKDRRKLYNIPTRPQPKPQPKRRSTRK